MMAAGVVLVAAVALLVGYLTGVLLASWDQGKQVDAAHRIGFAKGARYRCGCGCETERER